MRARLLEHGLSVVFVGALFLGALLWYNSSQSEVRTQRDAGLMPFLSLDSVDYSNSYHRELFRETVDAFYPGNDRLADSLLNALDTYRAERLTSREYKTGVQQTMTWSNVWSLFGMYLQFIVVYLVAMILTAIAGRSLAIYRFIAARRAVSSPQPESVPGNRWSDRLWPAFRSFFRWLGAAIAAVVLFSPAYVVAYALKGRFDTNSLLFLVLLAVLTNGVLINYATRFFTLLNAESRKGYVDTAVVKNLASEWSWNTPDGIPAKVLWQPRAAAPGHIFHHIYLQAHHQYRPALKEHASFLITGLIIIEMALNIQGHLGYELLTNLLYRRYDIVVTILFGIFLLVKITEVLVDWWVYRDARRYANVA